MGWRYCLLATWVDGRVSHVEWQLDSTVSGAVHSPYRRGAVSLNGLGYGAVILPPGTRLSSTIDRKNKMARPTQVSLTSHIVGSIPYGRRSIRCNLWHYNNNGLGPHFHGPCKFNVRLPYQGMVSQKGLMCTWWMQTRCLSWAHCLSWEFLSGKFAKNIPFPPRSNFCLPPNILLARLMKLSIAR